MTEFRSIAAATGEPHGDAFAVNTPADVAVACAKAGAAFDTYRALDLETRAAFLERIADEIMALGEPLIEAYTTESGLPRGRAEGERGRTCGQLRMFADVVRKGQFLQLRIDPAMPDRAPLPRPDLRLRMIPVGPVAVFGASNFPLAFSTAGGDTASALAAGCPVVVKGHPAHPITGSLIAQAITKAVADAGLPEGVFQHLVGPSNELGGALVQDPNIMAVGFTGSRAGGLALTRLAQAREVPIPVYAEMSAINPVLVLPEAMKAKGAALGEAFVGSLCMGAGQFCTNPGLVLAIEGEGLDAFVAAASGGVSAAKPQTMLTKGIAAAYANGVAKLAANAGVEEIARGEPGSETTGGAVLFKTTAEKFLADKAMGEEVFGSSSVIVVCKDAGELKTLLEGIEGQLTATIHMEDADEAIAAAVLPTLERKVGRILVNGWPTGVEVCHAMVHGGPFPATTDARTTSVGSLAIDRYLRPVSYQNLSQSLLPPELRDAAFGDGAPRLIDGKLTTN
ncbi:aldehyde dehydrogenase (NADP(+)) [Novosphingobium sp. 1949]|uniref:Aldehyde dehydrogenase (NADP(+)) n=1 Tax=Novosphingobium organovorum TaxID=2930092 RepID=A0ABT0BCK5_9SPHN|nr:aldehyde dehydrogenase (NADP(+)) [Novosphingobium organovorum]MCJ2182782.1 aldehyde dehydrogenase (NADP(+)) [Novosphingobium organovorum]